MAIIDPHYQAQLSELHRKGKFNHGAKAYKVVEHFIKQYQPTSVLDFGCGHGALITVIHDLHPTIALAGYDPGSEQYKNLPSSQFDAVVSTDAIEHIEPEHLDQTLRTIGQLMQRCGCFRIACYPAKKHLPDGRNAHLVVKEPDWWRSKLIDVMGVRIISEQVSVMDKSSKWAWVKGHVYDVIVEKA